MTKQQILDWYCKTHCSEGLPVLKCGQRLIICKKYMELSDMLSQYRADIVESVPCELVQCSGGYVCDHMKKKNEAWKKQESKS